MGCQDFWGLHCLFIGIFLIEASRFQNGLSTSLLIVEFRHFRLVALNIFEEYCHGHGSIIWLLYDCWFWCLQGNPIDWVSTHRYHHQFCDSNRDPHSPIEGFWFSHMSWLFDTNSVIEKVTLSLSFSNMQALTYAQNELIFLMFCINGTFAVWRTNQCWGSTAAALLQVSSGYLHSSSNCTWSFAICSRRVSLPCLGNGKRVFQFSHVLRISLFCLEYSFLEHRDILS